MELELHGKKVWMHFTIPYIINVLGAGHVDVCDTAKNILDYSLCV